MSLFSTQVSTVGGFATSMKTVQRTYGYVGFIDYQPNSAKSAPYHKTWTPSLKTLLPQDLLTQPIAETFYNT